MLITASQISAILLTEVAHHEVVRLVFITEVSDCNAACTDDLSWQAILVNLTKPCPFTKLLVVWDIDQGNTLLSAEPLHELLVRGFVAGFCKHHHLSLARIQGLRDLMKSANGTIHLEGIAKDALA